MENIKEELGGTLKIVGEFGARTKSKEFNSAVFNGAIDTLVNQKKEERVTMILKAYEKNDALVKEIQSIKPDGPQTVSEEGTVSPKTYTVETFNKKTTLVNKRSALDNALKECLETHSEEAYKKLQNLIK